MQPFSLQELKQGVAALALSDIYVCTSSWKYEGWLGLLYTQERYLTRGKFSRAKLESTCLKEYAEFFKAVCLDGGFYQFPSDQTVSRLFEQVPPDFRLSLKVTEDITTKRFRIFLGTANELAKKTRIFWTST